MPLRRFATWTIRHHTMDNSPHSSNNSQRMSYHQVM